MTDELPPLPEPPNGGWWDTAAIDAMRAYAAAAVARERDRWKMTLFDGWTVLQHLDERAKRRTSHENVSDVLDAVAAAIRKG